LQHHQHQHRHQYRRSNSGSMSSTIKTGQGSNAQQLELSARAVTSNGSAQRESIPSSLKVDELSLLPLHHERSNGVGSSIHQRSPRSTGRGGQQQQQWEQQGDRWGPDGWDSGEEECVPRGGCSGGSGCHGLHPEACTQARTVGRVASQVELEVGSHNHHVHFQVSKGFGPSDEVAKGNFSTSLSRLCMPLDLPENLLATGGQNEPGAHPVLLCAAVSQCGVM
jgi:hypothetical protein